MSFLRTLKSAAFGYLLLDNPQASQCLYFNNAYTEASVVQNNQSFCGSSHLFVPSSYGFYEPVRPLSEREIQDLQNADILFAFESSADKKETWLSSVSNLASTTYDYARQLIYPRESYNYKKINKNELTLQKLLGHIFEFKKTKYLDFDLELGGVIPKSDLVDIMDDTFYDIVDTFFSKFSEYKDRIDSERILSALKEGINLSKKNSNIVYVDNITDPNETIIIHGGWVGHAIDIIFSDNYLIICNKGPRPYDAYQIEANNIDRKTIRAKTIIDEISKSNWKTREESEYLLYTLLPRLFQGKKDRICQALVYLINSDQIAPNCEWESKETGLEALIGLKYFLKYRDKMRDPLYFKIHIGEVHGMMEHFREYAKWYILDKYEDFHKKHPEIPMNEDLLQKAKDNLDLQKVNKKSTFFDKDGYTITPYIDDDRFY